MRLHYNNAIGDVITSLQKTYVEETDPIMKFFIKAVINNFRYLRKKEYYLSLLEKFNYKFTDEEIKAEARKRIREYINEEGQPVFSDITSLIDRDIFAAYIDVSRAYYNLNLNVPNLHPDGYEINWSEDYFYYARAGNHDIPRFNDYILTPEAEKSLRKILEDAVKNKDENFGNARFVRNTFETVGRRQANRIAWQKDISDNDLRILIPEDLIS